MRPGMDAAQDTSDGGAERTWSVLSSGHGSSATDPSFQETFATRRTACASAMSSAGSESMPATWQSGWLARTRRAGCRRYRIRPHGRRAVRPAHGHTHPNGNGGMADRPQERNLRADLGPARKTLHWRPTVTLPAGIGRTVAHSTAPDHPLPAQPVPAQLYSSSARHPMTSSPKLTTGTA